MSLEFYDKTNKLLYGDFKGYMKEGASWNDAAVIGTAVSTYATQRNTVDGITGILTSGASRFGMDKIVYDNTTTMQRPTMAQAISASDERVVVTQGDSSGQQSAHHRRLWPEDLSSLRLAARFGPDQLV